MSSKIKSIKAALDASVNAVCNSCAMFSKHPGSDFTRTRKLPLRKLLSFILSMEGGTLKTEMLRHFGCSAEISSPAAFVQQRSKINSEAFPALFDLFVQNTDNDLTHHPVYPDYCHDPEFVAMYFGNASGWQYPYGEAYLRHGFSAESSGAATICEAPLSFGPQCWRHYIGAHSKT